MNLVLIFGPQAVGKMTVGRALEKVTDFKLFHNHMTIEMLSPIFGFTPEMWELCHQFRMDVFKKAIETKTNLIFTCVWSFDSEFDWSYMHTVKDLFESNGGNVYFVELEAPLDKRLERNVTPYRLAEKPTKRDVEWSNNELVATLEKHRLNSNPGEIEAAFYTRINNTYLQPDEVAQQIKQQFHLSSI
jgi:hypothetical protein